MSKTLNQKISIMQAFANGKQIEYAALSDGIPYEIVEEYEYIQNPSWDWSKYDYRIKKKEKKIKESDILFVGFIKKSKSNYVFINKTLLDALEFNKSYKIEVYECKQLSEPQVCYLK